MQRTKMKSTEEKYRIHRDNMKNKKDNGITLIALVITIIVLLILAGVTIATLTGENGILTRATDAKEQTEIASVREQAQLDMTNWIADKMKNGEDATVNTPEKVQEILEATNQNNENKYYKGFTDTGITTPNGYEVPYEELYINSSGGGETTSKTVEDLVAGDRVYYDTGNTSIENQGIIECIVLYDSSSEYGVQIIAADTVDTVILGDSNFNTAMNSYNNAITTLNAKAEEEYLNTTYASDARCVGSVPNNKNTESGNFTSEYSYMSSYTSFKDADTNYETDYNQMGTLNIRRANSDYWLASRSVDSGTISSYFNVRSVNTNGIVKGIDFCYVGSSGNIRANERSKGFRPVFTLKSGIKVTEGDGEATPYTLAP